ncbi:MAG: hydroxylamine reductase [Cloacibacillus sp.]
MFCYQCEQRAKNIACEVSGVCGKEPVCSDLQDLLLHRTMLLARAAVEKGAPTESVAGVIIDNLFSTVTNVNFDAKSIAAKIASTTALAAKTAEEPAPREESFEEMTAAAAPFSPRTDIEKYGADLGGLKWLAIYGLKGTAAYAFHARELGRTDEKVDAFFIEAMASLLCSDITVEKMLALNLKIGETNISVMAMLDAANTGTYGDPEPTSVRVTPVKGKAVLISGHDLKALEELLKQTEGTGVNVYTHCEMLPCNAYPALKKYPHLVGNYGGAWQNQQTEFDEFPGAIVMSTNCIQRPKPTYIDRIFTMELVEWPGVRHIENYDFAPVIKAALAAPGFTEDVPEKRITIGFAHNAVMAAAPKVIELVKAGKLRHFFLIGGCDGAKPGRNYYTDFAENVPNDCAILTLACGKYRFNKLDFGDIEGIPRLLDCGQCNDAYSAVRIAMALAEAFGTDVNGLPLSLILSWYEQKAVCILLSLLFLGIKNIRLGPTLPSFIGPEVLKVLVEKFEIKPTGDAKEDLKAILG